jgi:energy-coupling factor transporter transmembrane protein EcfT
MSEVIGYVDDRSGKQYVRTFLFSMQINSPLARLHVITKVVIILVTSTLIVRLMDARAPDPLGVGVLMVAGLLLLLLSGAGRWLFRSYLVVIFPMLSVLFITWVIFNRDPGTHVFLSLPITQQVSLVASDANLLAALTKVLGYAAMVFVSLTLVMTTRDIEFVGAMQQLRIPYVAAFFLSLVLRTLSSAVMDYETIRQAQVARGVALQPRSLPGRLRDMAHMSVPLVATMIRRSTEVSDAVIARGFRLGGAAPTEYHEAQPLHAGDWVVLALQGLLLVAVFYPSANLTHWVGLR